MSKRSETITTLDAQYVCMFSPEPEGGYTVTCPALPEVVTYGVTLEQARHNAKEAIELVLESYQEEGRTLPESDIDPRKALQEVVAVKLAHV
jgi:predicted RNase H-like HicB family nuclease